MRDGREAPRPHLIGRFTRIRHIQTSAEERTVVVGLHSLWKSGWVFFFLIGREFFFCPPLTHTFRLGLQQTR